MSDADEPFETLVGALQYLQVPEPPPRRTLPQAHQEPVQTRNTPDPAEDEPVRTVSIAELLDPGFCFEVDEPADDPVFASLIGGLQPDLSAILHAVPDLDPSPESPHESWGPVRFCRPARPRRTRPALALAVLRVEETLWDQPELDVERIMAGIRARAAAHGIKATPAPRKPTRPAPRPTEPASTSSARPRRRRSLLGGRRPTDRISQASEPPPCAPRSNRSTTFHVEPKFDMDEDLLEGVSLPPEVVAKATTGPWTRSTVPVATERPVPASMSASEEDLEDGATGETAAPMSFSSFEEDAGDDWSYD